MSDVSSLVNAYNSHFGNKANTILEIGSRDGHDAYYLSLKFNADNVYTFEANPSSYKIISLNYPQFNNICGAVSNFSGEASFNAVQSSNWDEVGTSSLRDRTDTWYSGKAQKITVSVDTMKNYIEMYNIPTPFDIVKIDVEGCSYEVLEGFDQYLEQIKVMHIENETYQYWQGQKLAKDVGKMLSLRGFFKEYEENFGTNSVDEVWINGNIV